MLGAYQDSRPQGSEARKRARLGWPDLFVFAVYLFMAMPLPQIFDALTGGFAYPDRTVCVAEAGALRLLRNRRILQFWCQRFFGGPLCHKPEV